MLNCLQVDLNNACIPEHPKRRQKVMMQHLFFLNNEHLMDQSRQKSGEPEDGSSIIDHAICEVDGSVQSGGLLISRTGSRLAQIYCQIQV
jgi:hypothetical protein